MTNRMTSIRSIAAGTFLILGSFCFVQCSSHEDGADGGAMQHQGQRADGTNVDPVTGAELNREINATYAEQQASMQADGQGGTVQTTTVIVYTPAKERLMATNDMRGLRSLLMADLEAVRARLNDGARPEAAREADKALAADLAQGLERVDRALTALGEANDATWSSMRDAQLREVAEVRSWMADYRAKDDWTMK
ncbi:MAG: hypothetical protein R2811_04000 [Flavobacteriales bacterium]